MKKSFLFVIISVLIISFCACSKDPEPTPKDTKSDKEVTESVEDDETDYTESDDEFEDKDNDIDDFFGNNFEDDDFFEDDYDDEDDYFEDDYDDDDFFEDDYEDDDFFEDDYDEDDYDDDDFDEYDDSDDVDDVDNNDISEPDDTETGMRVLKDYDGNAVAEFYVPDGYVINTDYSTSNELYFFNEEIDDDLMISFEDRMYYGELLESGRKITFGDTYAYTDSETLGTELEGVNEDPEYDDYEFSHTIIFLGYDRYYEGRAVYSVIEYGDVPRTYRLMYVKLGEDSWICIRARSFQQDGIFNEEAIDAQIDLYNSLF